MNMIGQTISDEGAAQRYHDMLWLELESPLPNDNPSLLEYGFVFVMTPMCATCFIVPSLVV